MSSRALVTAAYVVLCITWGSTYLAIRVGVEHLPVALFGAFRFLVAGALLLGITRALGRPLPRRRSDWRTNAVVGLLLLTGANGLVIWAEQFVASGIASLIVVTVSLWFAVFDAIIPGSRSRPTAAQFVGLVAGFAGTVLLVGGDFESLRQADWRGPIALTVAAMLWALGSIFSQRRPTESGPYVDSALQMLAGGAGLLVAGTAAGEWSRLEVTWTGAWVVTYLIVIGSLVGFTAYVYVLRHMPATLAGTYAYMNAIVAVFLGWLFLDERITLSTVVAMVVVMGAVAWVKSESRKPKPVVRGDTAIPALRDAYLIERGTSDCDDGSEPARAHSRRRVG